MNSTERVRNTILGLPTDRQPIYGWVEFDLKEQITEAFGSVANFEDKYEFDAAHIFGGPSPVKEDVVKAIAAENDELTPDLLVDADFMTDPDNMDAYAGMIASIAHHKVRGRFCYVQTPGFFEHYNGVFGIENHLMYLALYPDELAELYRRQADWTIRFADRCLELGVDMIHISDDWGAQRSMMFSPDMWRELIKPHLSRVVKHVRSRGALCSLHSDGHIMPVVDELIEMGLNLVHPWQENADMPLDTYLEKYSDKLATMGGICVQSVLGIMNTQDMLADIRRVFGKLRGKRWVCCTSHFVTDRCSMSDLAAAYDLIYKLARE